MVSLIRKLTKKYGTDKTNEIIEELMLEHIRYQDLCDALQYVVDTGRTDYNPLRIE